MRMLIYLIISCSGSVVVSRKKDMADSVVKMFVNLIDCHGKKGDHKTVVIVVMWLLWFCLQSPLLCKGRGKIEDITSCS